MVLQYCYALFPTCPTWTIDLLALLFVFLCILSASTWSKSCQVLEPNPAFERFQKQYLGVYFIILFADWLQGTNMYTLYQSYQVNISALFLTGFLSSAFFSTFIGEYVDTMGRKKAILLYCILEIAINAMEHVNSLTILMIGRVLGGLSTSLLFSAFESWMVTQHRTSGFPESYLSSTFSKASIGNGMLAILAGIASQGAEHYAGIIGPFQLAICMTIIAMLMVYSWDENYGTGIRTTNASGRAHFSRNILLVGFGYSLFEGAMYTFVFLWVPTLQNVVPKGDLPTGIVFACLMVCIAIGGQVYGFLKRVFLDQTIAIFLCVSSTISLGLASLSSSWHIVLMCFLCFEVCVGAFSPCSATLRSMYIQKEDMGAVLSLYRLPLNLFVVLGTKLSDSYPPSFVFQYCCAGFFVSSLCHACIVNKSKVQ